MTIETSVVSDQEFQQLARLPDYVRKGPGCISREENGIFYVVISQSANEDEASLNEAVKTEWEAQQKAIRPGGVESGPAVASPEFEAEEPAVTHPDNPHELVMHNGIMIPKSDRDACLRTHPDVIPMRHDPESRRPRDPRPAWIDFSRWPF